MTDIRPELIKRESDMHHFECLLWCRHERATDGGPELPGRGFSLVAGEVILAGNNRFLLFFVEYGIQNTNGMNWIPVSPIPTSTPPTRHPQESKLNKMDFSSTGPQKSPV